MLLSALFSGLFMASNVTHHKKKNWIKTCQCSHCSIYSQGRFIHSNRDVKGRLTNIRQIGLCLALLMFLLSSLPLQGILQEPLGEDGSPSGPAVLSHLRHTGHFPDAHKGGHPQAPCGCGHPQHLPIPLPAWLGAWYVLRVLKKGLGMAGLTRLFCRCGGSSFSRVHERIRITSNLLKHLENEHRRTGPVKRQPYTQTYVHRILQWPEQMKTFVLYSPVQQSVI